MLNLIPAGLRVRVSPYRYLFYTLSGLLMIGSLSLFLVRGLNYGIDFSGGTLIELSSKEEIDLGSLRAKLSALNLGDVAAQHFGSPKEALVRIEGTQKDKEGYARVEQAGIKKVRAALEGKYQFRRVEAVGPKVSSELIIAGIIAVLVAVAMVLIYIWARFEWQFSLGAVLALVHDVTLMIGVFSLLSFEFNLSIVAAILMIIGYSLNDTVVVYDRIRENLRKYRKVELGVLLDTSITQTLSRTVMTSLTTLLALFSLYFIGGEVLRGFAFAMIWGIIVGTYSSVFIASPLLMMMEVKRDWQTTS